MSSRKSCYYRNKNIYLNINKYEGLTGVWGSAVHWRQSEIFTLSVERVLALLILGHFVRLVLLALLAVSPAGFRYVHLQNKPQIYLHD